MDTLEKQFSINEICKQNNSSFVKNGYEDTQAWLLDSKKSKIKFCEKLENNDYCKGCILAIYGIIEKDSDRNPCLGGHSNNLKIKTITFADMEEIENFIAQQNMFLSAMKKLGYEYRVYAGNSEGPLIEFVKYIQENKNLNNGVVQNFVSILEKIAFYKYLKETIGRCSSPKSNKTRKFTKEDYPSQA